MTNDYPDDILVVKTLTLMRTLNVTHRENMVPGEQVCFAPKTLEQIDNALAAARRLAHVERWVFTATELNDPDLCKSDDMFDTGPVLLPVGPSTQLEDCTEMGLLVYRNGKVTNCWADGTAGVDNDLKEIAEGHETYIALDGGEYADQWHDVVVHEDGSFHRFLDSY